MAELTLFFDRNIGLRVPKMLRSLRPPVAIKGHQEVGFAKDAPDDEWLPTVGQKGWVVITQDRKFHRVESELEALKSHSVRCFYLHGASDAVWYTFRTIITAFPRIVHIAEQIPPPFIYQVKGKRVWPVKM